MSNLSVVEYADPLVFKIRHGRCVFSVDLNVDVNVFIKFPMSFLSEYKPPCVHWPTNRNANRSSIFFIIDSTLSTFSSVFLKTFVLAPQKHTSTGFCKFKLC